MLQPLPPPQRPFPAPAPALNVAAGRRAARRELARRAQTLGCDALDAAELLALVGGGGAAAPPLHELERARPAELERRHGLAPAEALRIAAAFALGRRLAAQARPPRAPLRSAARVHELLRDELQGLERETFHVLLLDGKHALRARELVSVGTLTTSLVHPREVFRAAVREAAAAVICAHNHPSGDPEPSPEDLEVTRRLLQAGKLLGIPLLDHVVIAGRGYVSLRERMGF